MTGIETDAVLFHGVDRGWMQAQVIAWKAEDAMAEMEEAGDE